MARSSCGQLAQQRAADRGLSLRRIAFFTSTRAEYGLLRPLMAEVATRPELALQVIVSGTHLSEVHGATWREIVADGFPIDMRVEMAIASDDTQSVALSAAQVLSGVAGQRARQIGRAHV